MIEKMNGRGSSFPTPVARQFTDAVVRKGVIQFKDGSTLDSSGFLRVGTGCAKPLRRLLCLLRSSRLVPIE